MKFLETINFFGYDVLVPIDRIKFISITYKKSWELHIKSIDEDYEWVECFEDEKKLDKRYKQIKEIIGAK